MSEPTIADAEPADRHEQSLDLAPDDDSGPPEEVPWESHPADLLEQQRAVPGDDERDDEHQR